MGVGGWGSFPRAQPFPAGRGPAAGAPLPPPFPAIPLSFPARPTVIPAPAGIQNPGGAGAITAGDMVSAGFPQFQQKWAASQAARRGTPQ